MHLGNSWHSLDSLDSKSTSVAILTWEGHSDQGFRLFKDKLLDHVTRKPQGQAELLTKEKGDLQWVMEKGDNAHHLKFQDHLRYRDYSSSHLISSLTSLPEERPLRSWKSCFLCIGGEVDPGRTGVGCSAHELGPQTFLHRPGYQSPAECSSGSFSICLGWGVSSPKVTPF